MVSHHQAMAIEGHVAKYISSSEYLVIRVRHGFRSYFEFLRIVRLNIKSLAQQEIHYAGSGNPSHACLYPMHPRYVVMESYHASSSGTRECFTLFCTLNCASVSSRVVYVAASASNGGYIPCWDDNSVKKRVVSGVCYSCPANCEKILVQSASTCSCIGCDSVCTSNALSEN